MTSEQPDQPEYDGPSKSERKREHKNIQAFASALLGAPESQLIRLGLPDHLLDEIRAARPMEKSARKRQIGFIGKLMSRDLDIAFITEAERMFESFKHPAAAANSRFHKLEQWRDSLISEENNKLIEQLVTELNADRQRLRTLVRQARRELENQAPPAAARTLFRYLRQLSEES